VRRDPTGREAPPGHRLVVGGLRSPGGDPGALERTITDIIAAKAELHDDLVVVTGLRAGAEALGARAALRAGVPFIAVLPYPDPAKAWPADARERFDELVDAAADVIVLQAKVPADRAGALGAIGRRDAWFARNASEALLIWDHDDPEVGRLVRSFTDVLGELDVWVLDPAT
jgi:hypothetical protein